MPKVIPSLQNRAVGQGQPFSPENAYRSLEFWDQVQRKLNDEISAATRAGKPEFAREYGLVRDKLLSEMDRLVPSFRDARGSAASFFGKNDALEAGIEFLGNKKITSEQTIHAMRSMSPEERALFQKSAMNEFMRTMGDVNTNHDLWKKIDANPNMGEKLRIVFGDQGYRQLEAMGRVERIMQMANTAARGNSSTAHQLIVNSMLGSGGLAYDLYNQQGIGGTGTVLGALAIGGRALGNRANAQVANRLADMLTSGDPRVIQRAIDVVANNNTAMQMVRNFGGAAAARGAGAEAARRGTAE